MDKKEFMKTCREINRLCSILWALHRKGECQKLGLTQEEQIEAENLLWSAVLVGEFVRNDIGFSYYLPYTQEGEKSES